MKFIEYIRLNLIHFSAFKKQNAISSQNWESNNTQGSGSLGSLPRTYTADYNKILLYVRLPVNTLLHASLSVILVITRILESYPWL